jgi:hypothetical protein
VNPGSESVADAPVASGILTFPDGAAERPELAIDSLFAQRLRDLYRTRGTTLMVWLLLCAASMLATLIWTGAQSFVPELIVLGLFAVPIAIVLFFQHRAAQNAFFTTYASSRGLQVAGSNAFAFSSPLMRRGDERKWPHVLGGRIGQCSDAQIAWYTYTDITRTDDGEQRNDHDFTLVSLRLPAPVASRFLGVYCRDRSLIGFGKLRDAFSSDRAVELESVAFHKRYDLRVADAQDDVALFELFNPTFIDTLTREVSSPQWEQVGPDLILFWDGHLQSSRELDAACDAAVHIHNRYLEEYR